jgi:signal transduction histidine kinase
MPGDTNAELNALRTVLRDLVALSAMPAAWASREPAAAAAGLVDALTGLLQLDFVFVRLCVPGIAGAVEVTRGEAWPTFPEWLESYLAKNGGLAGKEVIPDVEGDPGPCRGVVVPVGVNAEGGVVAAACERIDFPTETDRLLLSLAANHAATVFQSARLKEHRAQVWFLESLDRIDRAIQKAVDLEQMMGDVLDAVLVTFSCDRAWLVYPCDPEVGAHRVRMERARPEYNGAVRGSTEIPDDPDVASIAQRALASSGPVRFGPESDCALPAPLADRSGVTSMIAMAVYPKVDKPYLFGLSQCSNPRIWAPPEVRLFQEIGRRLADALDAQLMLRNLRESERKLERSRAELAASRSRIVMATDQTRRQIERDLHDGVQQRLVSLVLRQRMAEESVPPDQRKLRVQLSDVADGLEAAIEELREISRGIHPAILVHGGLVSALKALARRSAVPVTLEVHVGTRLPEPVEVATYYVASEALTNAAKHAHASAVHITVEARDGVLRLSIRDDGSGGANPARGSGLIGLSDRIDALGGAFEMTSPVGQGTTLQITLPVDAG